MNDNLKQQPGILGKLWKLLISMKTALILLGILALAAGIGTIASQVSLEEEKVQHFGQIWQMLGFSHFYSKLWFKVLLGLLCVNLFVCSVQRVNRIYRMTFKAKIPNYITDIPRKICFETTEKSDYLIDAVEQVFRGKGFLFSTEENEEHFAFVAQKRRLGNWGSLITHLAFVTLIMGAMTSSMMGYTGYFMVGAGSTVELQAVEVTKGEMTGTNFSIIVNSVEERHLSGGELDNWYSDLSIIEAGKVVAHQILSVNHPLRYQGITLYQSEFANGARFTLNDDGKKTTVLLRQGAGDLYQIPGTDFYLGAGEPNNETMNTDIIYQVLTDHGATIFKKGQLNRGQTVEIRDKLLLTYNDPVGFTGIQVKKDPGEWIVWLACGLLMLGLYLSFYWHPLVIKGLIIGDKQLLVIGAVSGRIPRRNAEEFDNYINDIQAYIKTHKRKRRQNESDTSEY